MSSPSAFRPGARIIGRVVAGAALAVITVTTITCSDRAGPLPTTPPDAATVGGPRAATLTTSCLRTDATALQQGISTLFDQSVRQTARTLERAVEGGCPNTGPMLDYVTAILTWRAQGLVAGTQTDGGNPALWTYLTRLFNYTGYTLPNSALALTKAGFIGVCDDTADCALVSTLQTSGIKIYRGALGGRRVLITGAPASCSAASALTNLKLWGQCVEISADPKDSASFRLSAPSDPTRTSPAVVQTCIAEDIHDLALVRYLYDTTGQGGVKPGRLGKLSGGATRVGVQPVEAPFFVANCDWAQSVAAGPSAPTGALGSVTRVASRALEGVAALFAPQVANAAHGGLGTLPGGTSSLSLFGPIDPFVFQATFTNDPVGQTPVVDDRGRGRWFAATVNPGDITVQPGLGDITSNLVVLNQQGGASSNKSGIQLLAVLASQTGQPSTATDGVYRIRWSSLIASSKPFGANFNVLDSQGRVLAQFTYANGTAAKTGPVQFNGISAGTWTQFASQPYEITVDLDRRVVSFGLQGATPLVSNVPYLNAAGADLARVGWQFLSQNAQTIGMDDVEIVRLPDAVRP